MFWIEFWGKNGALGYIFPSNGGHCSYWRHLRGMEAFHKLGVWNCARNIIGAVPTGISKCSDNKSAVIGGCFWSSLGVIGGCLRNSMAVIGGCTRNILAVISGCSRTILAGRLLVAAPVWDVGECTVAHSALEPGPLHVDNLLVILDTLDCSEDFTAELAGIVTTWNNNEYNYQK